MSSQQVAEQTGTTSQQSQEHSQLQERESRSQGTGHDDAWKQQGSLPQPSDVHPQVQAELGQALEASASLMPHEDPAMAASAAQADAAVFDWQDDWMQDIQALRIAAPSTPTLAPAVNQPPSSNNIHQAQGIVTPTASQQPDPASQSFRFNFSVDSSENAETPKAARAPAGPPAKASRQEPARVQISLRLEHMRLSDGDLGQLADWAQSEAGRAENRQVMAV